MKIDFISTGKVAMKRTRRFALLTLMLFLVLAGTSSGAELGPLPASGNAHIDAPKAIPFDLPALKKNWRERIAAIQAKGMLPVIDIELQFE
jgi:hypothetical protein